MLVVPGPSGKDTCDGVTRRELLRVGGSALLGLTLADLFGLHKTAAANESTGGPGFGRAENEVAASLRLIGASRVCAPGDLQSPPLDWPRDGLPALGSLAREGAENP